MAAIETDPLSSEEAARLGDFARACKAAARVVALYPSTHPAIQSSLQRVTESAARLRAHDTAVLTVLPDSVLLGGRGTPRPDAALGELAALLHAHLIGEMRLTGDLGPEGWHTFLRILARTRDEVRADGGIVRAWASAGGGPIELRQIDYSEVLRERKGALESDWDAIIANYLEGEWSDLNEETLAILFEISIDPERFRAFTEKLVLQAAEGGKQEPVLGLLQALADFVAAHHPDQLDRTLTHMAGAVPRLTPELVVTLITTGGPSAGPDREPGIDLAHEVRQRLSNRDVAEFIARSVSRDQGASGRLAEAFQALVPGAESRAEVLQMAQDEAQNLPVGRQADFAELWKSAAELLTSYSDAQFVSAEYSRELAAARTQAIEVERVSDDPPDRIATWLATVSDQEMRRLDQQVLLDLLAIETKPEAWQKTLESAQGLIDQLVLLGDIALAQPVLDAVVEAAQPGAPFAEAAQKGLDALRSGALMKHVVILTRQLPDEEVKGLAHFCRTLGPGVIGHLAEALAIEHGIAVKRLREILLSFGAAGRAYADGLRTSANPAVRRTAIELLRAFGGADALPDLAALLDDAEPAIQRDALRAIVQIGTPEAYAILEKALKSSGPQARDAMMRVLSASRDERAAPLFIHILENRDYRGGFESVYGQAIEALGHLGGDADSVEALKRVVQRGEWWAPRRTARFRTAAAMALRACGTPAAQQALDELAARGPGSARRAAKAALAAQPPRPQKGGSS